MVHKLANIYINFKSASMCNTYFYGLRWVQTQRPRRAAHTLATPPIVHPWFTACFLPDFTTCLVEKLWATEGLTSFVVQK